MTRLFARERVVVTVSGVLAKVGQYPEGAIATSYVDCEAALFGLTGYVLKNNHSKIARSIPVPVGATGTLYSVSIFNDVLLDLDEPVRVDVEVDGRLGVWLALFLGTLWVPDDSFEVLPR